MFDQCDGDLAYPVVKNFEFTFDIHTVNIARVSISKNLGLIVPPYTGFILTYRKQYTNRPKWPNFRRKLGNRLFSAFSSAETLKMIQLSLPVIWSCPRMVFGSLLQSLANLKANIDAQKTLNHIQFISTFFLLKMLSLTGKVFGHVTRSS